MLLEANVTMSYILYTYTNALSKRTYKRKKIRERENIFVFVDVCSCMSIQFVCYIHWCLPHVYVPVSACGNQYTWGIVAQVVTACWRWSIVVSSYSPLVCLLAWRFLYRLSPPPLPINGFWKGIYQTVKGFAYWFSYKLQMNPSKLWRLNTESRNYYIYSFVL